MKIYRANKPAEYYRNASSEHALEADASFERCDTDGFLSQWASGISSRINDALANLAENGGLANFEVLADLDGNEVHAKPIPTRYGTAWAILDDNNQITDFAPWKPARKTTLAKRGYQEVIKSLPAVVATEGGSSYNVNVFLYAEQWLS